MLQVWLPTTKHLPYHPLPRNFRGGGQDSSLVAPETKRVFASYHPPPLRSTSCMSLIGVDATSPPQVSWR
jgi:hypothetical protein